MSASGASKRRRVAAASAATLPTIFTFGVEMPAPISMTSVIEELYSLNWYDITGRAVPRSLLVNSLLILRFGTGEMSWILRIPPYGANPAIDMQVNLPPSQHNLARIKLKLMIEMVDPLCDVFYFYLSAGEMLRLVDRYNFVQILPEGRYKFSFPLYRAHVRPESFPSHLRVQWPATGLFLSSAGSVAAASSRSHASSASAAVAASRTSAPGGPDAPSSSSLLASQIFLMQGGSPNPQDLFDLSDREVSKSRPSTKPPPL